jgi:hypothetical protein
MMLELTEQQRQAVHEQAREPVEVIDPVTRCAYVLLSREQYERMQSLEERHCGNEILASHAFPPSWTLGTTVTSPFIGGF